MLTVKTKNTKGYALIEILLAFGIATIIIVAMVSLAVVTVRAATTTKAYAEAGKVAQSQAERLKLLRDTSPWSTFWTDLVVPCKDQLCHFDPISKILVKGTSGSVGTAPAEVSFSFTTDYDSANVREFSYSVVTTWNISDVAKTYTIEGLLSDWQSR